MVCQPGRRWGARRGPHPGLHLPVRCPWPGPAAGGARGERRRSRPTGPTSRRSAGPSLGRLPGAAVELHLHRLDAGVLLPRARRRPAPARPSRVARRRARRCARPASPGRLGPAALGPVRRERVERRHLDVHAPTCTPTRSRRGRAPSCGPGTRARSAAARRSSRAPASRRGRRSAPTAACRTSSRRPRSACTASAPDCTPASCSRSSSRTPLHQALLIRWPPTGLETQLSVIQISVRRRVEQVVRRSA